MADENITLSALAVDVAKVSTIVTTIDQRMERFERAMEDFRKDAIQVIEIKALSENNKERIDTLYSICWWGAAIIIGSVLLSMLSLVLPHVTNITH